MKIIKINHSFQIDNVFSMYIYDYILDTIYEKKIRCLLIFGFDSYLK